MLLKKYRQQEHIEEQKENTSNARKIEAETHAKTIEAIARINERVKTRIPLCDHCVKRHSDQC